MALQAILAIASTRVVAKINSVAVGLELLIVVVLAVALIVAVLITGTGSTDRPGMTATIELTGEVVRERRTSSWTTH